MSQRKIGHACCAGLLAAVLLLAGSVPAGAAGGGPANLWSWMMEEWKGWTGGVFLPWRSAEPPSAGNGTWIKQGPGIDPNGGTVCQGCDDPEQGTDPGGSL